MSYSSKARALYTKAETAPGVFSDPTDKTNVYVNPTLVSNRLREVTFTADPEKDDENSRYLTGTFVGDESIAGKVPGKVSYSIKLAPGEFNKDVTNDVASVHTLNYEKFLKAACLNSQYIKDDTVLKTEYSYPGKTIFWPSVSASGNTLSHTVVERNGETGKGIGYDVQGVASTMTLSVDGVGKPFTMKFEGSGGVEDVYEIASIDMDKIKFDSDEVSETIASKFLNTEIKITDLATGLSRTVCVNKLELTSGNQITEVECQAGNSGIKYNVTTGMEPRLSFNPELQDLSEFDYFKALTNEAFYKIEVTVVDKAAKDGSDFEPLVITIPRAQMLSATINEDNSFLRNDIVFRPLINLDKELPVVTYFDDTNGTETTYDFTGTNIEKEAVEAVFTLIIGEEYVRDI